MNYYETLYIIHPALDAGRVKEIVLSVNNTLEKNGGNIASIDVWGKKKLAYEIDKQRYGTYILVQFSGDGSGNAKFNVELEHNPNILAYLTLKIEEHKIKNQSQSLDEQISGEQSPPSKNEESQADEKKSETNEVEKSEENLDTDDKSETSSEDIVEESPADESSTEDSEVKESTEENNEEKVEE